MHANVGWEFDVSRLGGLPLTIGVLPCSLFEIALLPMQDAKDEPSGQTMMERAEKRVAAAGA